MRTIESQREDIRDLQHDIVVKNPNYASFIPDMRRSAKLGFAN
jgi:hypothetical protein